MKPQKSDIYLASTMNTHVSNLIESNCSVIIMNLSLNYLRNFIHELIEINLSLERKDGENIIFSVE